MRRNSIIGLVAVVLLAFSQMALAADMLSGTWKLNVAKSKFSPADLAPKSGTSKIEVSSDSIHVATEGVDSKGSKTHTDYTAKLDGKVVPTNATVDGKPNVDADGSMWKKVDDFTYESGSTLKGKTLTTTKVVISKDGKTRTNTVTGKNAQGLAVSNSLVYEKQ